MSALLVTAAPIIVLAAAIAFDVYCLKDLARTDIVLYLPRETWSAVICLLTPFGGIAYLTLGRTR